MGTFLGLPKSIECLDAMAKSIVLSLDRIHKYMKVENEELEVCCIFSVYHACNKVSLQAIYYHQSTLSAFLDETLADMQKIAVSVCTICTHDSFASSVIIVDLHMQIIVLSMYA